MLGSFLMRFLHTADLHLAKPFGRFDADTQAALNHLNRRRRLKIRGRQTFLSNSPHEGSFRFLFTEDSSRIYEFWAEESSVSPVWRIDLDGIPKIETAVPKNVWLLECASPWILKDFLETSPIVRQSETDVWISFGRCNFILTTTSELADDEIGYFCNREEINSITASITSVSDEGHMQHQQAISLHALQNSFERKSEKLEYLDKIVASIHASNLSQKEKLTLPTTLKKAVLAENKALSGLTDKLLKNSFHLVDLASNHDLHRPDLSSFESEISTAARELYQQAYSIGNAVGGLHEDVGPHSLLGTAVANIAIQKISEFAVEAVRMDQYRERVGTLLAAAPTANLVEFLKGSNQTLSLSRADGEVWLDNVEVSEIREEEIIEPVAYFTERDGFGSSPFTVTAPAQSISGGGSVEWSITTITAELSHSVMGAYVTELLLKIDLSLLQDEMAYTLLRSQSETVGDALALQILEAAIILYGEGFPESDFNEWMHNNPEELARVAMNQKASECEEILAFMFDFFHFNGQDSMVYCERIVVASLSLSSHDNVLTNTISRLLGALAMPLLGQSDWQEKTVATLKNILNQSHLLRALPQQAEILSELNKIRYRKQSASFWTPIFLLGQVFRTGFRSTSLQVSLASELLGRPRKLRRQYQHRPTFFESALSQNAKNSFSNPLVFTREFAREHKKNPALAVWIYHMLCFGLAPREHEVLAK